MATESEKTEFIPPLVYGDTKDISFTDWYTNPGIYGRREIPEYQQRLGQAAHKFTTDAEAEAIVQDITQKHANAARILRDYPGIMLEAAQVDSERREREFVASLERRRPMKRVA